LGNYNEKMTLFVADSELFAAFLSPGRQNFPASLGFHAGQKPVDFQVFAFLKLGYRHGVWV